MNMIPLLITSSWNQSYGKSSSAATSYGRLTVFPLMFFDVDIIRRTVRANNVCSDDGRLPSVLRTFLTMSSRLTPTFIPTYKVDNNVNPSNVNENNFPPNGMLLNFVFGGEERNV